MYALLVSVTVWLYEPVPVTPFESYRNAPLPPVTSIRCVAFVDGVTEFPQLSRPIIMAHAFASTAVTLDVSDIVDELLNVVSASGWVDVSHPVYQAAAISIDDEPEPVYVAVTIPDVAPFIYHP